MQRNRQGEGDVGKRNGMGRINLLKEEGRDEDRVDVEVAAFGDGRQDISDVDLWLRGGGGPSKEKGNPH